jgi:hypothetical protein
MKTLPEICHQLSLGQYELSRYAFRRAVERNIGEAEIKQAGTQAELIEIYPEDKYAPSALLLGFTQTGRPLHIQVSYVDSELVKIITLYEPDAGQWYNYRQRR